MGKGDLYINIIINGVKQGMKGPFYANAFETKQKVKRIDLNSSGRSDKGQVLDSVAIPEAPELTIGLDQADKDTMCMALLGTAAAHTQTAGTLAAEDVVAKLDTWIALSKEAITSAALTVTDSTAATTFIEGQDYLVNRQLGWIKPLSTGVITAEQALKVTAAYSAFTGTKISGATKSDIRAEFVLDGINQADGSLCIATVHEAIISSDAAFAFMGDKFNDIKLTASMKTPTGKTEPFTIKQRAAA